MSQHADLLKWEIVRALKHKNSWVELLESVQGLLQTLDYDESFTNMHTVTEHTYSALLQMAMQKDGLYGPSRNDLNLMASMIWTHNQWLPA